MKQPLYIILAIATLTSCYQDIDLGDTEKEQRVVMNCIANTDTTIMADVGRTWLYTSNRRGEDIKDLDIAIRINGQDAGHMTYNGDKYLSSVKPKAGDVVEVSTVADGKELYACDTMPQKTMIEAVDMEYHPTITAGESVVGPDGSATTDYRGYELTYNIRIKDQPGKRNYYFLRVVSTDQHNYIGNMDFSYDMVFQLMEEEASGSLTNREIDGLYGLPFSDRGIDGTEYTIKVKEKGSLYHYSGDPAMPRRIRLYSVSEAYYHYLVSLHATDKDQSVSGGMADLGLAEPANVYTNIKGGIGIMGCLQLSTKDISVGKYIKK